MLSEQSTQSYTPIQQGGVLEVNHQISGKNEINMDIDLKQFGGIKPEFDMLEREDDKAIENLNAQLLGIQTGGQNDKLELAKQAGVASVMNNYASTQDLRNQQVSNNNEQSNTYSPSGLNFSFHNQTGGNPRIESEMSPSMILANRPNTVGNLGMNTEMNGGGDNKQVSFNNNIKVIELDTKVSEGFLYSGSKNLDPFSQ